MWLWKIDDLWEPKMFGQNCQDLLNEAANERQKNVKRRVEKA